MNNFHLKNSGTDIVTLGSLFIFALGIRIGYLLQMKRTILFDKFILDAYYYDNWARGIASGDWLGKEVFYGMPLYPYFLGIIYAIFGRNILMAKLIQFLIGSLSPILIYLIAKRLFNRPVGLISGFIAAAYNMFIFYEGELIDSGLSIFLYLLAFYLLLLADEKAKKIIYFLTGITFGLAALSRPGILSFIPLVLIWLVFLAKKKRIQFAAAFILGLILTISIATVRNYLVAKDFVPISAHSGINFYIGNNENADGKFDVPASMSTNAEDLMKDAKFFAERDTARALKPSEVSRYWFYRSLGFIRNSPLKFIKLIGKKIILFWNTYEIPDIQDYYFIKHEFRFFKIPFWSFVLICPLSLLGMGLAIYNWRRLFLLYAFIISYLCSILLYFVNSRYRLAIIPLLIIFASYGLWWFYEKIKNKEYRKTLVSLAVFTLLFFLTNINSQKINFSTSFSNLGDIFLKEGRVEEAKKFYERAIQEDPGASKPFNDLGLIYIGSGQLDQAFKMLSRAIELEPDNARAHSNLGLVYFKKRRYAQAIDEFIRAIQLNPGLAEAHNNLGASYLFTSQKEKAVAEFKEALRINPDDRSAKFNLKEAKNSAMTEFP